MTDLDEQAHEAAAREIVKDWCFLSESERVEWRVEIKAGVAAYLAARGPAGPHAVMDATAILRKYTPLSVESCRAVAGEMLAFAGRGSSTPANDDLKAAREALAMIEAMGGDALESPQELALRARSALRLPPPSGSSTPCKTCGGSGVVSEPVEGVETPPNLDALAETTGDDDG